MGIFYRANDGTERVVAGLAPAGQLVPSVSLYQSGTASGASAQTTTLNPGEFTIITISLPTSMPDSNYVVQAGTDSAYILAEESPSVRGTTSFRLYLTNQSLTETVDVSEVTIKWQAFKLMTDEVTALDETRIEQNTKNFAPNFSATASYSVGDYVTYNNVLYRCTVQHTASAWNSSHFTQVTVGGDLANSGLAKTIRLTNSDLGWNDADVKTALSRIVEYVESHPEVKTLAENGQLFIKDVHISGGHGTCLVCDNGTSYCYGIYFSWYLPNIYYWQGRRDHGSAEVVVTKFSGTTI